MYVGKIECIFLFFFIYLYVDFRLLKLCSSLIYLVARVQSISRITNTYGVFGLTNYSIQNKTMYYGSISQIWWNSLIYHINTN